MDTSNSSPATETATSTVPPPPWSSALFRSDCRSVSSWADTPQATPLAAGCCTASSMSIPRPRASSTTCAATSAGEYRWGRTLDASTPAASRTLSVTRSIRRAVRSITSQRVRTSASADSSASRWAAVAMYPRGLRNSWTTRATGSLNASSTEWQPFRHNRAPRSLAAAHVPAYRPIGRISGADCTSPPRLSTRPTNLGGPFLRTARAHPESAHTKANAPGEPGLSDNDSSPVAQREPPIIRTWTPATAGWSRFAPGCVGGGEGSLR